MLLFFIILFIICEPIPKLDCVWDPSTLINYPFIKDKKLEELVELPVLRTGFFYSHICYKSYII